MPKGTNVTRLAPNIDYGSGTGTAVADEFTSGRSHDFTNPVQYVLTAPDGVTKITYTVTVVFYDETQGGSGETEHTHTWDAGVITKEATTSSTGIKTYTCTVCQSKREEEIPKLVVLPTNTPVPTATPTNTPAPTGYKVGTTVKHPATNGYYKVTATDTVEYIKPIKKKVSTVTIPDSVNLKGVNYKVTSIASKAFKSNKYLKKAIIGNNVIQIKSYAFYKCTKLSYVQIGGSVKAIGKQSFYGCKKLNEMRIYTSRLKAKYVGSNAFKGTPSRMKIYVPRKKAKSYKTVFVKRGISKKIVIKKM